MSTVLISMISQARACRACPSAWDLRIGDQCRRLAVSPTLQRVQLCAFPASITPWNVSHLGSQIQHSWTDSWIFVASANGKNLPLVWSSWCQPPRLRVFASLVLEASETLAAGCSKSAAQFQIACAACVLTSFIYIILYNYCICVFTHSLITIN